MATLFPAIYEKRYVNYPRRWLVEYHVDGRSRYPDAKGSCITKVSARAAAAKAIINGYVHTVRIFDRRNGQYECTLKKSDFGIREHLGYVK
jgi:hypothetical protein